VERWYINRRDGNEARTAEQSLFRTRTCKRHLSLLSLCSLRLKGYRFLSLLFLSCVTTIRLSFLEQERAGEREGRSATVDRIDILSHKCMPKLLLLSIKEKFRMRDCFIDRSCNSLLMPTPGWGRCVSAFYPVFDYALSSNFGYSAQCRSPARGTRRRRGR